MTPERAQGKRVALYVRVSTDKQSVEAQERELQAVAERHGWNVIAIYRDAGVSGKNGREKRPGFNRLWQAITAREVDVVAVWAIDRLGRSLVHLIQIMLDMKAKGVDLYVHVQGIDTSTPTGELMFNLLGSLAQWERSMLSARTVAGLKRAAAQGRKGGRPYLDAKLVAKVKAKLAEGESKVSIARELHVGLKSVFRIASGEHGKPREVPSVRRTDRASR